MRTDFERRIEYPTLARMAVQSRLTGEMTAEEMRVLYVAMTRACEKLILVGSGGNIEKMLARTGRAKLHPQYLLSQNTYAAWILAAMGGGVEIINAADVETAQSPVLEALPEEYTVSGEAGDDGYAYPLDDARLPAKMSVTEIKRRFDRLALSDGEPLDKRFLYSTPLRKPNFTKHGEAKKELSAAERGTAVHAVLERIPFDLPDNFEAVSKFLDKLCAGGIISDIEAKSVGTDKIASFLRSEICARMRAAEAAGTLRREVRFILNVPSELAGEAAGKTVMVQGVIDCMFEHGGEVVILDYKTGRANASDYAVQMNLYKAAAEGITSKRVSELIIYFFDGGTAATVERSVSLPI
jgi:ATP-dependent helicase/nuclease subunit A